ncbi:hypothetical protein ACIQPT_33435 [Streptomyces sp. NPDC091289]|uniref:hypothetical protein n=1 Tax=Streptomyces sp. NPDC091289 TaxID=3365989 RepID=UPI00380F35DB
MVSTGRLHGFESLEEQQLLLALDYFGVAEVLPQPFRLDFDSSEGKRWHVRPEGLIEDDDAMKFAATAQSASACGWRYSVAVGWRPHVHSVLDHLSSQRRPLVDQLGLQRELEDAVARGVDRFGDLVEGTCLPAVARAHATHLLWWRRLGVDLGSPLGDGSLIWRGRASAGGS